MKKKILFMAEAVYNASGLGLPIVMTLGNDGGESDARARAKQVLRGMPAVSNVMDTDGGLTVYAKNAGFIIADIVRAFDANNIRLTSVNFSAPTLDDVFLQHTGRRIRTEDLNTKQSFSRFGAARRPTRE